MDKRLAPEIRIGLALRARREAMDWSQEKLSFELGLHRTYIGAVERGEKNITLRNIIRVAVALQVPASSILKVAGLWLPGIKRPHASWDRFVLPSAR